MNSVDRTSEFWAAPDEALFPQAVIEAVTGLSAASFERWRWSGLGGPQHIKLGRSVRYSKRAVVHWINESSSGSGRPDDV